MKFHKILGLVTVVNFLACIVVFYILFRSSSDQNGKGIDLALGWIYWLGIMTFIVPVSVPANIRAEWFSKEYGVGSLVLLLVNVLAAIAGDHIAYTLAK
jgi:hypothetical protein